MIRVLFLKQKRKNGWFFVYLRLLSNIAAAAATMIMTAAPIAMYVDVDVWLVGGGAMLGDGEDVHLRI